MSHPSSTDSAPRVDALPRVLAERFRLDAVLGRGGMGVVYAGVDLRSGSPVAVKVIRPDGAAGQVEAERFVREAKNTARLIHPHVVEVLDLGRSAEGELYFAMEQLDGESLARLLHREHRLACDRVAHIGRQICSALAAAHRAGIIHRDIKPANVMLVRHGAERDFIKVLDFGIARALDGETRLTTTGQLVGTLEYMAPEQILGAPFDGRADLYALGATLYRLATGATLFPNTSPATVVYHHVNTAPEPPSVRAPEASIPRPLERVILRCLEKAPENRYARAEEVADALAAAMAGAAEDELGPTSPARAPPPAPLAAVSELELDTDATREVPYRKCAVCQTESSRFSTRCSSCGADLTTPQQLDYLARTLGSQRTPATPPLQVSAPKPFAAPARAEAPAASARELSGLADFLKSLPVSLWQRIAFYSATASGVLWFFNMISSRTALGLAALAAAGVVGLYFGRDDLVD